MQNDSLLRLFLKQISVSMTEAVAFKNLPSRNWHSSVASSPAQ